MNKYNWIEIVIIGILLLIIFFSPVKEREVIKSQVDTVFIDSIKYIRLEDSIKKEIKYIETIRYEKDKKLQYIDSISNDSAVKLFIKLVEGGS